MSEIYTNLCGACKLVKIYTLFDTSMRQIIPLRINH